MLGLLSNLPTESKLYIDWGNNSFGSYYYCPYRRDLPSLFLRTPRPPLWPGSCVIRRWISLALGSIHVHLFSEDFQLGLLTSKFTSGYGTIVVIRTSHHNSFIIGGTGINLFGSPDEWLWSGLTSHEFYLAMNELTISKAREHRISSNRNVSGLRPYLSMIMIAKLIAHHTKMCEKNSIGRPCVAKFPTPWYRHLKKRTQHLEIWTN